MHGIEIGVEAAGVTLQRQHVAEHKADRVIQFMRDAGHQATQRNHLLGMQQLALRAFQVVVRLAQRRIGAAQFANRTTGDHHAHQFAGLRQARRAVHRDRYGRPVAGTQKELAVVHALAPEAGKDFTRLGPFDIVGKQVEDRLVLQLFYRLAGDMRQRGIDLLDIAVAVADDQDVRHRGEHALDELVRLLERGVLLFERHFVLEEVVIDLVHFLDDFDPGLLAELLGGRRQGRIEARISGPAGSGHALRRVRRGRDDARVRGQSR